MKRHLLPLLFLGCSVAMVGAFASHATAKEATAKAGKAPMAKYLVISPHTEEECLKALDDVQSMGSSALGKWDFGCMDGDHTGYCIVSASSSEEALKSVPESVRDKAKAVKLHRFTAAELKAAHEKMKS